MNDYVGIVRKDGIYKMAINQINKIVNSIVGQAIGRQNLIGTDTSFVSLGNEILSSSESTESVYSVLIDRIGRTVSSIRPYFARASKMRRNPMEWGVVLQKLSMPLSPAVENPAWLGVDDTSDGNVLAPANTQKPIQKLFNRVSTWEHDGTIWNNQLRHAFTSPEAMMAFIDMLFTAVYNSQEMAFENLDNLCRANLIAQLVNEVNQPRVIKLLTMYNNINGSSLTPAQAMLDKDFLVYAAQTISLYSQRMETMSVTFNDGSVERHTPRNMQSMTMLADFAKAFSYVAKSEVFHNDIVSMPNYVEVPFWQGYKGLASTTNLWDFNETSKVDVLVETGDDSPSEVTTSGVIALLSDFETYGTTVMNQSSSSMYNPRRKFTNYFYQADTGYYNDLSENAIVFLLE